MERFVGKYVPGTVYVPRVYNKNRGYDLTQMTVMIKNDGWHNDM